MVKISENKKNIEDSLFIFGKIPNHYSFYKNIINCHTGFKIIFQTNIKTFLLVNNQNAPSTKYNVRRNLFVYPVIRKGQTKAIFDEPFEIYDILKVLFYRRKVNIYLTIHNVNKWFFPESNRGKSFNLIDKFKEYLRKKIVKKYQNFICVSSNVYQFCLNNIPYKSFRLINFASDKVSVIDNKNIGHYNKIIVVIPGTISRARNYDNIIKVIKGIGNTEKLYEFIFLGVPLGDYGQEIIGKLNALNFQNIKIWTFDSFIPTELFNKILMDCDLIYSDFNLEFKTKEGYIEIYGKTKETGVAPLAYTFNKPLLVPESYVVPKEQLVNTMFFDSCQDAMEIIKNFQVAK